MFIMASQAEGRGFESRISLLLSLLNIKSLRDVWQIFCFILI